MITRRKLLMGLAGGVAIATAAVTLVRAKPQYTASTWSLTQPIHGDRPYIVDPDPCHRVTAFDRHVGKRTTHRVWYGYTEHRNARYHAKPTEPHITRDYGHGNVWYEILREQANVVS